MDWSDLHFTVATCSSEAKGSVGNRATRRKYISSSLAAGAKRQTDDAAETQGVKGGAASSEQASRHPSTSDMPSRAMHRTPSKGPAKLNASGLQIAPTRKE